MVPHRADANLARQFPHGEAFAAFGVEQPGRSFAEPLAEVGNVSLGEDARHQESLDISRLAKAGMYMR